MYLREAGAREAYLELRQTPGHIRDPGILWNRRDYFDPEALLANFTVHVHPDEVPPEAVKSSDDLWVGAGRAE